jgi:hypothetical protein
MKIEVNVTKSRMSLIIGIIFIIGGIVLGYAYNSNFNSNSANAPVFGHSADELNVNIDGQIMTLQEAINQGKLGSTNIQQLPNGYVERDTNLDEDVYNKGFFYNTGLPDTCNGDRTNQYACLPDETKTCDDYYSTTYYRKVNCYGIKTLVKYTGNNPYLFYWNGVVDSNAYITINGTSESAYFDNLANGAGQIGWSYATAAGMPKDGRNLILKNVAGRCSGTNNPEITQQPSSSNGYTTIIHVNDGCADSSAGYNFMLDYQ